LLGGHSEAVQPEVALNSCVDSVMISALAVFYGSMALNSLENSPMHTSAYKPALRFFFCDCYTGTPHIHNSRHTEKASLEKKFILAQANHPLFEEEK